MHILSTLLAASVAVSGVLAIPVAGNDEVLTLSDPDYPNLVPQNFTASDGITYEIWIDSSFFNSTSEDLEKRQTGPANPPPPAARYGPKWNGRSTDQNKCRHSSFSMDTGPHAPTTGRCKAIQEWARKNKGFWSIKWQAITPNQYLPLLRSRKSGTTQCLFGVLHTAWEVRIGNTDIYDLIGDSLNKYSRQYNGVWRVRAWGRADCDGDLVQNGSAELKWGLTNDF